jgi:hypothetical protein
VYPTRSLPAFVAPLLLAFAVLGYLVGYRHAPTVSKAASGETTLILSEASVLLEYPSDWRRVASAPAVPGLAITHPVALAPGGNAARAGLLSGQLPAGEAGPLPARFVSPLRGLPRTDVLDFLGGQAYRYSMLRIPGYDRVLNLFVIPNPGSGSTALACYAAKPFASELQKCEQIVAKLTLVGQSQYDLNPDARYAQGLSTLIGALDRERLLLRREMRQRGTPAAVGSLAGTLAERLAGTARSLSALEQPLAAGAAQAALVGSILEARDTYSALAGAATSESLDAYNLALGKVDRAEAGVDTALTGFALLGYSHL